MEQRERNTNINITQIYTFINKKIMTEIFVKQKKN